MGFLHSWLEKPCVYCNTVGKTKYYMTKESAKMEKEYSVAYIKQMVTTCWSFTMSSLVGLHSSVLSFDIPRPPIRHADPIRHAFCSVDHALSVDFYTKGTDKPSGVLVVTSCIVTY